VSLLAVAAILEVSHVIVLKNVCEEPKSVFVITTVPVPTTAVIPVPASKSNVDSLVTL